MHKPAKILKNELPLGDRIHVESNTCTMKKVFFIMTGVILLSFSCSKTVRESIDCLSELATTFIADTANTLNPKEVIFTLTYPGSYSVSVLWKYGDGNTEQKTGLITTHVYDSAGGYKVKAEITLSGIDIGSCSGEREKNITVQ